jgi:starch-binding outer membrane protein, SusD/RagB family
MKQIKYKLLTIALLLLGAQGCDESVLQEKPLDFLSPTITLTNNAGFQSAITSLHQGFREVYAFDDANQWWSLHFATDIGSVGTNAQWLRDYNTQLTPTFTGVTHFWNWGYVTMLPRANQIIEYAERPTAVWANEAQKNAVIAEARFFRAYVFNLLTNLYGDVPIVEKIATEPKVDFVRNPRKDVLQFVKADLEFASANLPLTTTIPGRITKDAADHLLSEVYITIGEYAKSVEAATRVITSGRNRLMTARFGSLASQPGDVYSDLFKLGNQNRSSGNVENLWVVQYEFQTPGGFPTSNLGKNWLRAWGPFYQNAFDPAGRAGMVLADSMGRGVGWLRPNNHVTTNIWRDDPSDMRNSRFNIRRTWTYNNPASASFGRPVDFRTNPNIDTLLHFYPTFRKIEDQSIPTVGVGQGRTASDWPMMRLAETYLLRAEAYIMLNDAQKAADDVNVVRARARAKPATPAQMNLDYILDERLRELIIEEPRRLTLSRMNKLEDRIKRLNGFPVTVNSFQAKHRWYPIPQTFIDANFGVKIEQNPGY